MTHYNTINLHLLAERETRPQIHEINEATVGMSLPQRLYIDYERFIFGRYDYISFGQRVSACRVTETCSGLEVVFTL